MSQKKLKQARRLDAMRFKKAVKAYEEEQKRLEEFPPFVPPTISPLGQALEAAVSLIAPAITHAIPPRGTYVAPPQADSAVSTNLRGNGLSSYQTPVISTAFVTDSAAKVTTAPARDVSTRSTPKPVAPPAPPKNVTIPVSEPSVRKLETASVVNIFSTYAIDGAAPLEVDATSPTVLGTQVFGPPDPSDPDQLPTIAYIDKLTGVAKPVTDMSGNPILNGSGEIAQWVLNGRYTLTQDGNDLKIGPVGVRNLDDSLMVTSVVKGYFSSEINAANSGIRLGTTLPATLSYPNPPQSFTLSAGKTAASTIAIPSSDVRGRALVATATGGTLNLSILAGNGVEIETYPIASSFDASFSPQFYKDSAGANFVVYKKGGSTFNTRISSQDVPATSASAGIPAGSTLVTDATFTLPTGERIDGLQVSQPALEAATTFIPCVLLPAGHIESPLVPQAELYFQTNRDTNLKILPNAGSSLVIGGDDCSESSFDGVAMTCNKFSGADFSALGDLTPVTGSQREAAIDDLPSSDSASTDSTFGGVVAANGQKVSCPNCVSGIEAQEVATILTEDYEAPSASASITSSASTTRSSSKSKTASLTQSATTTTSITGSGSASRSASSSNSRSNTASLSAEQTSSTSITSSDSGSGSQTMTGSDSNSASASGSGSRSASSSNSRSKTASLSAEQTSSTSITSSDSGSGSQTMTGSDSNSASASGSGSRSASSSNSRSKTASLSVEQTSSTSIPPSASGSSKASTTKASSLGVSTSANTSISSSRSRSKQPHSASSSLTPSTKESEVSIPSTTTSTSQGKSSAFNKTWQVVTGVLAGIAAVALGVLGFRQRQHRQAARRIHDYETAVGGNGENGAQFVIAGEEEAKSSRDSDSEREEVPVAPFEREDKAPARGATAQADIRDGTPNLPGQVDGAETPPQTRAGIVLLDAAGHRGAARLAPVTPEQRTK